MAFRERKPKKLGRDALKDYALKSLGGRAHSLGELRQKLRNKAESPEDVQPVLDELKQAGLLDDRQYASAFASARKENDGFGQGRVLRDLLQRRVAPAVAQQAIGEAYQAADEIPMIEAFLIRKFRRISLPEYLAEPKNLASAYRKLRLAGFSSGNTIRVLKRYAQQAGELESLEDAPE